MNEFDLYKAFQNVDDDILGRSQKRKRNTVAIRRIKAMAACFVLVLGMALTAEASTGSVSNLLAPLFGMAQTELVDEIGVPVGVSASADGYTITADAVIGDKYNIAVVYTLSRDDGKPLPERLSISLDNFLLTTGGRSLKWVANEQDPSKISLIESCDFAQPIFRRYWETSFSELVIRGEGEERTVIAKGPWQFKFTLRYKDVSRKIPVNKFRVSDELGNEYEVNQILMSPIGIYMKGYQFEPEFGGEPVMIHFDVTIIMKDGTVIPLEDHGAGGSFSQGAKKAKVNFRAMFDTPIDPEEVTALLICGTELPVK